ncbi:hypothetical protein RHO12_06475 [Orbus sturtevantii]|uniref:hypothetical protein n=1 Tax=Orbus sturtevantii TaxID=3074109 RepID=UPI00370D3018
MKYFKNSNNEVYAYESDGSQDSYITGDLIAISNLEANELVKKAQDLIRAKIEAQIPQLLNRFQMLTILRLTKLDDGSSLYQSADNYINALADDTIERVTVKTAWETAQEFCRDSTFIGMIQTEFKLTDVQVDNLFKQGIDIKA